MDYKNQAQDLWERLQQYKNSLSKAELIQVIEDELALTVQDHINKDNFRDFVDKKDEIENLKEELRILLQRSREHMEECASLLEASYLCACELERKTKQQFYEQVKKTTVNCSKLVQVLISRIKIIQ